MPKEEIRQISEETIRDPKRNTNQWIYVQFFLSNDRWRDMMRIRSTVSTRPRKNLKVTQFGLMNGVKTFRRQ